MIHDPESLGKMLERLRPFIPYLEVGDEVSTWTGQAWVDTLSSHPHAQH